MGTKFILGQEDGTVAGGNARGEGAVDLQTARSAANQVASGNLSTIVGGTNNRAYGVGVFVGGGSGNVAGGLDNYQTIVGGNSNTITAAGGSFIGGGLSNTVSNGSGSGYCVINGGQSNLSNGGTHNTIGGGLSNTVSSTYSTVSGGQTNTASTGTHATVVGGQSNTSSGAHSVSGGLTSTASGGRSVAFSASTASGQSSFAVGDVVTASGSKSIALGADSQATQLGAVAIGNVVSATAESSFASGNRSSAYLFGQNSRANGFFVGSGDAQQSLLTARREATLTTGGTTVLSLDGSGTTNLIIPSGTNRMWNVTIKYVAVVTTITGTATGVTVGDTKSQNIEIGFKKVGGVSSLVGGGSFSIPQEDASMGSASLIPTAGASQELALTFTAPTFVGGGSVTMRVVSKVELVEVAY